MIADWELLCLIATSNVTLANGALSNVRIICWIQCELRVSHLARDNPAESQFSKWTPDKNTDKRWIAEPTI